MEHSTARVINSAHEGNTQLIAGRIGDELRGARYSLNKSIEQVQHELKLRAGHVDAIERGDLNALPGPAYMAGYVRSYARYLGLDPEEVWTRFRIEHKLAALPAPVLGQQPKWQGGGLTAPAPARTGFPWLPILGVVASLGLLGVIAYGATVILNNLQRMPTAQPETPVISAPQPTPQPDRPSAAVYEGGVVQSLSAPPKVTGGDGPISAIDPKQTPQQAPTVEVTATAPAAGATTTDTAAPTTATVVAVTAPPAEPVNRLAFGLVTSADAWLRVTAPGDRKVFGGTLPMGQALALPTEQPLTLHVGNAGAVMIVVDGIAFGPVGAEGRVVKDLVVTPADVRARFKPVAGMAPVATPSKPPSVPKPAAVSAPAASAGTAN